MASLFSKIKTWFYSFFFGPKPVEVTPKVVEPTPAVEISRTPGINCPECKTRLVVSIQHLIQYQPVVCYNCGLELMIDQDKSQAAIESLRKLQSGLDQASKVRQETGI
jgi:DNA-directed RNA polymerase subunit RPC12/RpoP